MKKKFKFGRNLLSFMIILGGLLIICLIAFFIYMPVSAATYHNATTFTPYKPYTKYSEEGKETENSVPSSIDTTNLGYIKYEDFKDFDIKIKSVKYQAKTLKFSIRFEENDRTKELNIVKEDYKTKKATLCVTAPYANSVDYASSSSALTTGFRFYKSGGTGAYTSNDYTYTLSSLSYPITISNFPIFKTITKPNLYVYVKYQYTTDNAQLITKKYSIEFTPKQYYDDSFTNSADFYWHTK